jgi:hypothetical protein
MQVIICGVDTKDKFDQNPEHFGPTRSPWPARCNGRVLGSTIVQFRPTLAPGEGWDEKLGTTTRAKRRKRK